MPNKNFRSVTLDAELLAYAEEMIEHFNNVVGWKGFRSLSHFVETAIVDYIDQMDKLLEKEPKIKR